VKRIWVFLTGIFSLSLLFFALSCLTVDALVISDNNVGVGITNPSQSLDVNGNIKFSGSLMFPDGSTQSTATLQGPVGPQGPQGPQGPPGPSAPLPSCSNGRILIQWNNDWHCGLLMYYSDGIGICVGGICELISCRPYYGNCDGDVINGCESNLLSDPFNCSACFNTCDDTQRCYNGECIDCEDGWARCGGVNCDDLSNSYYNCGSCGNPCPLYLFCIDGQCSCQPGYTDCGGNCTDLNYDAGNCGECGHTCPANCFCVDGQCGGLLCPP